jgi:hypothetical protein
MEDPVVEALRQKWAAVTFLLPAADLPALVAGDGAAPVDAEAEGVPRLLAEMQPLLGRFADLADLALARRIEVAAPDADGERALAVAHHARIDPVMALAHAVERPQIFVERPGVEVLDDRQPRVRQRRRERQRGQQHGGEFHCDAHWAMDPVRTICVLAELSHCTGPPSSHNRCRTKPTPIAKRSTR